MIAGLATTVKNLISSALKRKRSHDDEPRDDRRPLSRQKLAQLNQEQQLSQQHHHHGPQLQLEPQVSKAVEPTGHAATGLQRHGSINHMGSQHEQPPETAQTSGRVMDASTGPAPAQIGPQAGGPSRSTAAFARTAFPKGAAGVAYLSRRQEASSRPGGSNPWLTSTARGGGGGAGAAVGGAGGGGAAPVAATPASAPRWGGADGITPVKALDFGLGASASKQPWGVRPGAQALPARRHTFGLDADAQDELRQASELEQLAAAKRGAVMARSAVRQHDGRDLTALRRYQKLLEEVNAHAATPGARSVGAVHSPEPGLLASRVAQRMPPALAPWLPPPAPATAGAARTSEAGPSDAARPGASVLPVAMLMVEESRAREEAEEKRRAADAAEARAAEVFDKGKSLRGRVDQLLGKLSLGEHSAASLAQAAAAEARLLAELRATEAAGPDWPRGRAVGAEPARLAAAPAATAAGERPVGVPAGRLPPKAAVPVKAVPRAEEEEEVVDLVSSEEEEEAVAEEVLPVYEEEEIEEEEEEEEEAIQPHHLARYQRWTSRAPATTSDAKRVLASHKGSGIDLTWKDVVCMAPLTWLNDEAVNLFMGLLQERDQRMRGRGWPACHFFNSFFMNKLFFDQGYTYNNVRRWTLPKRLPAAQASSHPFDCDIIFVPLNLGNTHWTGATIEVARQRLSYYDSMQGRRSDILNALARWVEDEYANKFKQEVDTSGWERRYPQCPQQQNGSDCGMFMLSYAEHLSRGSAFRFDQADIARLRIKYTNQMLDLHVK